MIKINNRAFTLVELLAVIAIIAVIALITVPVADRLINRTADKVYTNNEKALQIAAKNYYMENNNLLPNSVGSKTIVFLNELVDTGYMKRIKDLYDDTQYCDGYVLVEKIDEKRYTYNPFLECVSNYLTDGYYNTPPAINILGDNPVSILRGTTYTDAGARATDVRDKNISASIVTTGSVNTGVVGTYTITYRVTNTSAITTTLIRTVNVVAP